MGCFYFQSPAGWKTRDQLLKIHGGNTAVVDSIVDRKIQAGEWRYHPDLPEDDTAILFYVMLELDVLNQDESEERIEATASFRADFGSEAGW